MHSPSSTSHQNLPPKRRESSLVQRLLAGDSAALDDFSEAYIPPLYRFASSRLRGDREATVVVVQETMCKALSKLDTFRGEATLITWLCAVCRNEIALHFRAQNKRGRELEYTQAEETLVEPELRSHIDSPERHLQRQEKAQLVHAALDALPPHYAQALEWKYIDQRTVSEIAAGLELSVKAAESLLTRAREAFRKHYKRIVTEVEPSASHLQSCPALGQ